MEINITYSGVNLRVTGFYQPEERATRDYPGCEEWFEISEVFAADSNIDLVEMIDSHGLDMISVAVLENIKERQNAVD